jgi:hypothetical protein
MGLPGSLLSASKYKCAKLTPPAAPARALQLPEVVARARRVAPKWSRPLRVQDHSLGCAETKLFAFSSVLHAASSQRKQAAQALNRAAHSAQIVKRISLSIYASLLALGILPWAGGAWQNQFLCTQHTAALIHGID